LTAVTKVQNPADKS